MSNKPLLTDDTHTLLLGPRDQGRGKGKGLPASGLPVGQEQHRTRPGWTPGQRGWDGQVPGLGWTGE